MNKISVEFSNMEEFFDSEILDMLSNGYRILKRDGLVANSMQSSKSQRALIENLEEFFENNPGIPITYELILV